jgi:hypothetical protein
MPLISLAKAKFLQTLGRATRLHDHDRKRLYAATMKPDELRRFTKPYAWLIVPIYGAIGDDLQSEVAEYIKELRSYGFNPAEDIVIRQKRGKQVPEPIESVIEKNSGDSGLITFYSNVVHILEAEKDAELERLDLQVRAQLLSETLQIFVDIE